MNCWHKTITIILAFLEVEDSAKINKCKREIETFIQKVEQRKFHFRVKPALFKGAPQLF